MGGYAWVTLATNDSYSLGALVLAHSLRRVNTAHQLVVLITPGVTEAMKTQLSAVFNLVKLVDVLDSGDADNLALLARPELGITFTKLHCWKLTQYDKCVFLDADTLVLQNSDELFEREELSAAPDAGWPDCFNSGVFVYKPSNDTFKALIDFALVHGSFDGGDQGLLNLFFSDWATKDIKKHLPFVYNMVSTSTYSYLPAFKQFGHGLKILHFIGSAKPWLQPFNTETGLVQTRGDSPHVTQFVQLWWDLFCTTVHPSLSTEMSRHRLSSSYDFCAPQSVSSMQPFPSVESYYSEPTQLNHSDSETYTYFDPWDDVDKQNDARVSCESFQNDDGSLDNYLDTNSYSDHYHQFSDLQTNHKFVSERRDSSSTPQYHTSHNSSSEQSDAGTVQHSNHTVDVVREPLHSVVPINDGGGDPRLWSRPSRLDSLSQPEQRVPDGRVPLPLPVPVPEAHVVVETHTHSHLHSHVLPSSVQHVSPVEQTVRMEHAPSPEPDAGLAGALASVKLGAPISAEQAALEEHLRRQGWEQGNIDYMGKDSFSNIWQKICDTLAGTRVTPVEVPAPVAPVAAPTYVSSVEISPTGPIDTSPPASYAPVSVSKPTTVVASDTEPVTPVAASAETTTVVPEPKSPSVTELISTSAAKPQTPSSEASSETSTPLLESLSSVALLSSSGTQDPSTAVSGVESPITAPLEVLPTITAIENVSSDIQPVQAPTPQAIIPTETIVQTPVPLPSTQTEAQSPVPSPPTPVSKSVTPLVSTPTDSPVNIPIPLPSTPTEAPGQIPVPPSPTSTPQPPVPTTVVDSPVVPAPPTPAQPVAPAVPQAPEITSPSLPPTPLSTPPSSQTCPIASPPSKATPEQPSTPTVTGPTPPTSPPVGAVESPLATKLRVESEVPATPPVGESSSPPVLSKVPSDEPPVPPKRKGGSKTSQEPKGQKGKPAKGKK